ncbi:MAG TPA: Calx-beta domain-containing protein, partial [Candidatus Saccharimonadales bacterium]|nr:Calx-beta domain-containing protein [Candidatus Saccharimonadales bacterium]
MLRRLGTWSLWLGSVALLPAATFPVTSTADSGAGSLRQAILSANLTPGIHVIQFDLPSAAGRTITLRSELPALIHPVTIDGYSQPGASAGRPAIQLNGSEAPAAAGLILRGGRSAVRGLVLSSFAGAAVRLEDNGGDVVEGNFIGTDPSGTNSAPNGLGIFIGTNCSQNTIGGTNAASRNLISGNQGSGILIASGANGNVIQGNFIGTSADGASALGNTGPGIELRDAPGNTVGGTERQARNLISANGADGIRVTGPASRGTVIQQNWIGLDASGAVALANGGHGVALLETEQVTLGGTEPEAGNVIAGNLGSGIWLEGAGHVVQANRVGTDATGRFRRPNAVGVTARGTGHTLGGSIEARNVISGNAGDGLVLEASNTVVQANYVGVDSTGNAELGNGQSGIVLQGPAALNTIGGATADERNVVSGNGGAGLRLRGADVEGNAVQGNHVGLGSDGHTLLGNRAYGIVVEAAARENLIGGSDSGQGNVISANDAGGVLLTGGAEATVVLGNFVGLEGDGLSPAPNHGCGVCLDDGAKDSSIGASAPGWANRIAFNSGAGIFARGSLTTGNTWAGNSVFQNGALGIDLARAGEAQGTPTFNDATDADAGPNHLQNFPMITNIAHQGGLTAIQGTMRGAPGQAILIDVYHSAASDPSGYGQGEVHLGAVEVATEDDGATGFALLATGVFADRYFSATATDLDTGDTSEFSPAFLNSANLPSLRIQDIVVAAGAGGVGTAAFPVLLSTATARPVSVRFATSAGSALAGVDFVPTNGVLTLAPGDPGGAIAVSLVPNAARSGPATFFVSLSDPANAALADGQGTATIVQAEIGSIRLA